MFKFNLQIQVLGYSCLITLSDKIKDILIFTNRWLKFSNTIYPTSEDGIYTYIFFLLVSIREKSPCVTIRSTYGLHCRQSWKGATVCIKCAQLSVPPSGYPAASILISEILICLYPPR